MTIKLILASASPRRREILENAGLKFDIVVSNADENIETSGITPEMAVQEIALLKGAEVAKKLQSVNNLRQIVIAADTVVTLDGRIMGKPADRTAAREMLESLSGREHKVMTGLCIWDMSSGKGVTAYEETGVTFKRLDRNTVEEYLNTGEYADKAGAYGIQGKGSLLVKKIEGDYYNVVGLPINKLYETLNKECNINLFQYLS